VTGRRKLGSAATPREGSGQPAVSPVLSHLELVASRSCPE